MSDGQWTALVLFLIYSALENIHAEHMRMAKMASPLDQTPLDRKMWLDPPLSAVCSVITLVERVACYGFAVYVGFKTEWLIAPLILVVALGTDLVTATVAKLMRILGPISAFGFFINPVLAGAILALC